MRTPKTTHQLAAELLALPDGPVVVSEFILSAAQAHAIDQWKPCSKEMPDSDETVLVYSPKSDDPVWLGYWDSESDCWRAADACPIEVTHWAKIPEGPDHKGGAA